MSGRQNPKQRWKQVTLANARAAQRLTRRGRKYDPLRWTYSHTLRPNPHFKLKGKFRGSKTLEVPTTADFDGGRQVDEAVSLIGDLRKAALDGHFKKILIDLSNATSMSPEVALLILAEIQRCKAYCEGRSRITGTYPKNHDVAELLTEIGFFKALNIKAPKFPGSRKPRTYLRIESDNRTLAKVVDSLLACFSKEFSFDDDDRKRLHVALIECMDNVFEHAYRLESGDPYLYREWWLAGYADHEDSSIGFIFYDQGAGIPSTIRTKKHQRVLQRLRNWTDADWIERAIRKQISRHTSGRRGHGLEKLKKFLDRLDVEGSLRVIANRGDVEFYTSGRPSRIDKLEGSLDGTLIVWKLRGSAKCATKSALGNSDE